MSVYKGDKLVAGRSVDTYLVRNPDWANAVEITVEQLYAGYTAPSDGMFVCSRVMPKSNTTTDRAITVNGITITSGEYPDNSTYSYGSASCPVSEGDLIKSNINNAWTSERRYFVPFEDSGIEVGTSELIRNLHDPDWSQAVSITATQLIEGYTVPKRGIIVGSIIPNTYNVTGSPIIKINGITVSYARGSSNEISHGSVQCPVCANDRASLEGISAGSCDAHISFVPYKAQ